MKFMINKLFLRNIFMYNTQKLLKITPSFDKGGLGAI